MTDTYALTICRIVIIILFTLSAGGKILALKDFEVTIGDFKLIPRRWSRAAALLILAGEILVVGLLGLGGALLPIGFLLAIALLGLFSAALASALYRHIDVSCHCFGRTERRVSRYDVARNVLAIGCGLSGLALVNSPSPGLAAGELLLLLLMSSVFVVAALNLAEVVETLRRPLQVEGQR